jgi:hypothetical protein
LYASCSPLCARGVKVNIVNFTKVLVIFKKIFKTKRSKVDVDYKDKDKVDAVGIPFNTIALFTAALFIQPEAKELDACAPNEGDAGWPVCPCL